MLILKYFQFQEGMIFRYSITLSCQLFIVLYCSSNLHRLMELEMRLNVLIFIKHFNLKEY